MRGDRATIGSRRWLAAGAAGLAVVAVIVLSTVLRGPTAPTEPSVPGSPGATVPAATGGVAVPDVGPLVFTETLDAEASRLVLRVLDGHTAPRIVASRPDVNAGPAWTVDPTG